VLPLDESALLPACLELDKWRKTLDARGPLPRLWSGRLRRDLEAEAVAASTIMEGVPVTVDEVRRILAGDRPPDVTPESRALVEGYRDAMSFVLRRADDPHFRWDRELLVSLHDRVMAGDFALAAGRLRTGQRYLVNARTGDQVFLPPPADEVAALVDAACARIEEGFAHPAIGAAWIHVALAATHAFSDGNGRVARIAASLAMHRGGFKRPEFTSLEEWWGRHRDAYYRSFTCLGDRFDPGADVTSFGLAHVSAQVSQVRALDLRERAERQVWTAIENLLLDLGLPPRLANALWDAFFGRDVTAGYYRPLADVSPATATNDLAAATAAGLLRATGRRRGRRYLASEKLYDAVAGALEVERPDERESARVAIVAAVARRLAGSGGP
jgi:Fic family protein